MSRITFARICGAVSGVFIGGILAFVVWLTHLGTTSSSKALAWAGVIWMFVMIVGVLTIIISAKYVRVEVDDTTEPKGKEE